MKALRQAVIFTLVLCAGLYVWIFHVPVAQPLLIKTGLPDLLGITLKQPEAKDDTSARRGPGGPASVIVATVQSAEQVDRITAIGDGRARRSVTVRSNAMGVITDLTQAAGTVIKAGSVIARLQGEAEDIALAQARIRLEDAQTDKVRVRQLQDRGAVSEVRLRETEVALRTAELTVRQAEFDLSQRQITAPITGWIGILDVEVGDRVNAQDRLVTITDRSDILIDFRVPERVVSRISAGQKITVTPLGLRSMILTGEVAAIDTVVDRASRTMLVQGRVANADDLLRAGMAFSVSMTFPGETLLSIAPLAVQWSSDGPFVWAVREGKATPVPVALVQRNSDAVLVRSDGLSAGEDVVTEGVQTLRPGADVMPTNTQSSATPQGTADAKGKL